MGSRGRPCLIIGWVRSPSVRRVVDVDTLDRGRRVIVASEPPLRPRCGRAAAPRDASTSRRRAIGRTRARLDPEIGGAMLYPLPAPISCPAAATCSVSCTSRALAEIRLPAALGPAHRTGEAAAGSCASSCCGCAPRPTRRIGAVLPGSTGGIASALITGKRGTIAVGRQGGALRETGSSRTSLAIAGLHLGIVGRFVGSLPCAEFLRPDPAGRAHFPGSSTSPRSSPSSCCSVT